MSVTKARPDLDQFGTKTAIRRRTLAKGVAWTAPVVAVSVAAPAFAASGESLSAVWTEAIYSGANGRWSFCLEFVNNGAAEITVTSIQTYTSYHSPATNGSVPQVVVDTLNPNLSVKTSNNATNPVRYCSSKEEFAVEPRNGATSLLPEYYNDGDPEDSSDTDGEIDCVADGTALPVYPSDPTYPDSCKRLSADFTYLRVTYTSSGQEFMLALPFDATVGCRVTAGCQN